MRLIYFLALVAVIAAVWFRFRRRVEPDPGPAAAQKPVEWDPEPSYQAVSVKLGKNPCASATAIAGKHFEPAKAPRFPLEGCDKKHCDCTYRREPERREGGRRRNDDGLEDLIQTDNERRDQDRRG